MIVALAILVATAAYLVLQHDYLQPKHTPTYFLQSIAETRNDEPTITIDPTHVQVHAPRFYRMLETAFERGEGSTRNPDTQKEIRDYLQSQTGTPNTAIQILYRQTPFRLGVSTQ